MAVFTLTRYSSRTVRRDSNQLKSESSARILSIGSEVDGDNSVNESNSVERIWAAHNLSVLQI